MTQHDELPRKRSRRPRHKMQTIFARVAAVSPITPRMMRVTFASDQFVGFTAPFPDQFATLLFPHAHQTKPVIAPGFTWEEYQTMPEDVRPIVRNYTIRRSRPECGEIDIDFVLHGDSGFGSRWAMHAKPGLEVGLWGPRVGYNPAPEVDWQLLFGDETAVPAIGAILESLAAGTKARVIIEVADADDEQPLPTAGDVDVTWLHRGHAGHQPSDRLLAAVREVSFPPGVVYAWGAGEIETVQAYGKYLRRERGLKTSAISAIGYWRRDAV